MASRAAWLGGSEMAERVRGHDWAATPLGPLEDWPPSLRTAVGICLRSPFQMALYWGPSLICIYNDAEREIMGGLHPGALGQPAAELLRDSWDVLGPQLQAVLERGEATLAVDERLTFERRGKLEAGYFTYSYSPILDDAGGVGGVLLITEDTTARVLADRRAELLRRLVEASAEGETVAEACAAAAAALAGSADVPAAGLYLLGDDGRTATLAAASGGAPPGTLDALAVPTGVRVPAGRWLGGAREWEAAVRFPGGLLIAAIGDERLFDDAYRAHLEEIAAQVGRAVAGARVREAERRHARAVQELDAAKTALFSNASHELRTPLTLVLGGLEQAAEDSGQSAATRERLEVARRNAVRMLRLVNAMLDFSRLEAGVHTGVFQPTDLSGLTENLVAMFGSAAQLAGLRLECDCPPLGEPVYVDREAWEKIVGNLLSNALKFTPAGRIAVATALDGGDAVLTVEDTGIGIAPENLELVFSRFHRLSDPRARSREGSGIGLALVRELVHVHGGSVRAASEPDRGTRMTVRLPRGRDRLPAGEPVDGDGDVGAATALFVEDAVGWMARGAARPAADRWLSAVAAGEAPARVLVADDNRDMRDYLRQLLAPYFAVDVAEDGRRARAAATAAPPDVIVSDVMMPRMDGLELVRALRASPVLRDVPIVLLSARADAAGLEALRLGADDYLVKPIGARELVARVRATVQLARTRREAAETRGRLEERTRAEAELRALLADLRAAQRRVVAAADAARRQIERDLHDGAQQRLVAIQMRLGALRERLADDPEGAPAELDRLGAELRRSLDELRALAHGLFPALLAGEGLPGALAAAAREAGLPAELHAQDVGRLAPEVEAAAYFCCLEALQNAAKHAGPGARAVVRLGRDGERLAFSVADDGAGFDPARADGGFGLTNLRDRLAALGGEAEIVSAPGRGTTVSGTLPVTREG